MYDEYNTYYDNEQELTTEMAGGTQESWEEPETRTERSHRRKKKGMSAGKVLAIAISCTLIGGLAGAGSLAFAKNNNGTSVVFEGQRTVHPIETTQVNTEREMTPAEVYAANVNSTVGITTSVTTNYFGYQTKSAAAGSGFILTEDGYVLTNYHVIENSDSVKVSMYDGTSYDAEVIGYDKSNDIAVLKIDANGLTPVVLGSSDDLVVGDTVMAIGNPLGELTFSLTTGVVSALNREVTIQGNIAMDLIQTDAAINSGNSGGALFNAHGEVIGVTNAKYSSSGSLTSASVDNIGFAIPIDNIRGIVMSIIEKGYISRPYIGVSVQSLTTDMTRYGVPNGVSIVSVEEGSPAEEAGLQTDDIITHLNGEAVSSSSSLAKEIGHCTAGEEVTLTVYRKGETLEVKVIVGEHELSAKADDEEKEEKQDAQDNGNNGQNRGGSDDSGEYYDPYSGDLWDDFSGEFFGNDNPFSYDGHGFYYFPFG